MINESKINLFDLTTVIFLFILALLSVLFVSPPISIISSVIILTGIVFIYLLIRYSDINAVILTLRRFYIVFFMPIIFGYLHYLVPRVNLNIYDFHLIKLDHLLFGTHPTILLQSYYNQYLLILCQVSYSVYYFLPLIPALSLISGKRYRDFYFYAFVIELGFYISYLGYFLFPAIGPRVFLRHEYTTDTLFTNSFLHSIQTVLNGLENIQFDAFPSGHTMVTLLIVFFSFKYKIKFRYGLLIVSLFLIIATFYLQYHYISDVIAGILLALAIYFGSNHCYRKFSQRCFPSEN